MSPYTTPIAPTISAIVRLLSGGAVLTSELRGVVDAAREPDVELLQLAVEVGALEPRPLRNLAHVALLAAQELLEVDALEGLARLAQRQLEKARRDLGRGRRIGRRRLAQHALHVLG